MGQLVVHRLEAFDLLPDAPVSVREMRHLRGARLTFLLAVDADHLRDVALGAGLQVDQAAGDLALGEFAIPIVHRLELAAVDGHALALGQADPAAKLDKLRADLADAYAVVAPEIRDGLVIRHQFAGQPHDLDIATGLALRPAARRNAVQVAVDDQA